MTAVVQIGSSTVRLVCGMKRRGLCAVARAGVASGAAAYADTALSRSRRRIKGPPGASFLGSDLDRIEPGCNAPEERRYVWCVPARYLPLRTDHPSIVEITRGMLWLPTAGVRPRGKGLMSCHLVKSSDGGVVQTGADRRASPAPRPGGRAVPRPCMAGALCPRRGSPTRDRAARPDSGGAAGPFGNWSKHRLWSG